MKATSIRARLLLSLLPLFLLAEAVVGTITYRYVLHESHALFDYHLDDGDTGPAVVERLAARFGARPTVILSADASEAVRRDVQAAGFTLLRKPLKPLALKSVLDRLLASRELQPLEPISS